LRKLQSEGVHHITIVGANRQTSIDFWEGVLGMPFVFEQPNLDNQSESHLYFDPGDGRLITVFTNEDRVREPTRTSTEIGCVHHIAFAVSQATFRQAVGRLDERGIRHSGVKDRGFMDSIYFEDPLGLLIELASYRFEPPHGFTQRRGLVRVAQPARGARRLQHRPGAPHRRHRGARRAIASVPVRGPIAEGPIQLES
jgi:glyoxalase family protein